MMLFGRIGYFLSALVILPGMALAADTGCQCTPGEATHESYSWNFPREASNLLNSIQQDAAHAADHAAKLQQMDTQTTLSWQAEAGELNSIRTEVNDMGQKLCRLETIRSAVLPWQQNATDRAASLLPLMGDNATDAIAYVNRRQDEFWMPVFRHYTDNLYNESNQLSNSLHEFEQYAKVHGQDLNLGRELGMKAPA